VYGVVRDEDVAAGAGAGEIERTSNPWRYPGQYEDAETGLYYNRFRYYDPETGRYLSEDPIGLAGGVGLYGYVGAPSWWVDPFGLTCTRTGVKRDNPGDWKRLATLWKDTGVDALSDANLKNIDERLAPIVDDAWIRWFPGDAALKGEKISMHHVGGSRLSVPLPASRHKAAHMPGGYRFNPGGPGQSG
jgi:RHS repeat-associated protein